jgi:hypothetical protein
MNAPRDQKRVRDILLNNCLYFPTRLGFNDPFDCRIPILWDRSTSEEWKQKLLEHYKLKPIPKKWKGDFECYVDYLLQKKNIIAELKKNGPIAYEAALNKFQVMCFCKNVVMWRLWASKPNRRLSGLFIEIMARPRGSGQ